MNETLSTELLIGHERWTFPLPKSSLCILMYLQADAF